MIKLRPDQQTVGLGQRSVTHLWLDHPVKPDDDIKKMPDDDPGVLSAFYVAPLAATVIVRRRPLLSC